MSCLPERVPEEALSITVGPGGAIKCLRVLGSIVATDAILFYASLSRPGDAQIPPFLNLCRTLVVAVTEPPTEIVSSLADSSDLASSVYCLIQHFSDSGETSLQNLGVFMGHNG